MYTHVCMMDVCIYQHVYYTHTRRGNISEGYTLHIKTACLYVVGSRAAYSPLLFLYFSKVSNKHTHIILIRSQ